MIMATYCRSGVLLLVIMLCTVACGTAHPVVTGTSQPTSTAVPNTAIPTATPTNPFITTQQAWGAYSSRSLTFPAYTFEPQDITPDGTMLVGTTTTLIPNSPGIQTVASMAPVQGSPLQHIYTAPQDALSLSVATDGRYVFWLGGHVFTGGPLDNTEQNAGYMDLQSGKTTTLFAISKRLGSDPYDKAIDQGYLVWAPFTNGHTDFQVLNLATGQSIDLNQQPTGTGIHETFLSWPYILFESQASDMSLSEHFYDVQSQQDHVLTQIQRNNNYALHVPAGFFYDHVALAGSTVFWLHPGTQNDIVLSELDHADQPGAAVHDVAHIPWQYRNGNVFDMVANDRLVVWESSAVQSTPDTSYFAWDRATHKLILLASNVGPLPHIFMRGAQLITTTGDDKSTTDTIIDTSKLPTT